MEDEGAPYIDEADLLMEQVLDMLKLLDYENKFCKQKGFKPFNKVYFSQPHSNPSEQFINFISLVSWLLSVNNHQVTGWNKYDDPMTASQNVILELKKLGIQLDMPPNKLKSGNGDGVCSVLHALCEISVKNKVRFKQPTINDDGAGFGDEDGDDMGDEFEGNADIADEERDIVQSDDDIIDDDLDFAGVGAGQQAVNEDELLQQQIIHASIGREEWMLEVERVAHKLKINKVVSDGKEWRSHMD
jgi:estrogen-related receptor beta like 1